MIKPIMDVKALQLASRFSFPPNALGYCGKDTAPAKFKKCVIEGECAGVEDELSKFIVLHPYYKTIAEVTAHPVFSYPVVESYWIGNELLGQFKPEHYNILLDNFLEQGVPDFFVEELRSNPPKVFIPSHLFQVIFVGVGRASGVVPFDINSINECMIRWGRVLEINGDSVKVKLNSFKQSGKKYRLTAKNETLSLNDVFVPGLKTGDTVAVHWKQLIKVLTKDEEEKILFWTNEVIKGVEAQT
jgi:hypothetical protein